MWSLISVLMLWAQWASYERGKDYIWTGACQYKFVDAAKRKTNCEGMSKPARCSGTLEQASVAGVVQDRAVAWLGDVGSPEEPICCTHASLPLPLCCLCTIPGATALVCSQDNIVLNSVRCACVCVILVLKTATQCPSTTALLKPVLLFKTLIFLSTSSHPCFA